MTHDKRHRENQRRAQGRAYRRALADVLTARGENELAKQVLKAPMSSLPGITTALGLAPENVAAGASGGVIPGTGTTHTTGPEDAALIGNVAATYTPSLSGIRDTVLHRERTAHLASLGTEVRAARRRAERERAMIRQATGPVAVFEQGQRHKDACLDLAVAQDRQAAHTETLFADIDAACRGTALVPPFTGDVSRPTGEVPDPVAAEPLAAMGLTEWTDRRTGHLKPMYPATVAARARRTATREPGPVDRRADQFLLADLAERSPGFTVTSFEGALGSDTASVEVDGVITDEQGAVAGVAVVSRCPGDWSHGQPPVRDRARALYVAHVAGRPVALCALIDGVPTTVTLQPGETIDGTVTGPTVASQLDPIAAFRTLTTAAANGETVGPSAYRRGPINAANKYARLEAERNLAALLHSSLTPRQITTELNTKTAQGTDLDTAVRSLIAEHWSRESMGTLAGVDGETAAITDTHDGFTPQYSDWIETGIVRHDSSGTVSGTFTRLHGADERIVMVNGTGAEHVHHITPAMIAGKPRLTDPATRTEVRDELLAGQVLVAHNVTFEQDHLGHAIPGFDGQRPWLDTQWIAQHFLPPDQATPGRTGLKLQHLCEDTGIPYDGIDGPDRAGAHSAAYDAGVMMAALEQVFARPRWWEAQK